jgi:hypothetical protein
MSLRESILFVLRTFPAEGFTLGRGDTEPGQADAPFTRSGVFGQVRLNYVDDCRTQWLVAIGTQSSDTGGTSPLLPQPSPSVSTPFPAFGG